MRRLALVGIVAASLVTGAAPAEATATYEYVGNLYNDTFNGLPPKYLYKKTMNLTGELTLDAPLEPLGSFDFAEISSRLVSLSFFDGVQTLTGPSLVDASAQTNADGEIVEWFFRLEAKPDGKNFRFIESCEMELGCRRDHVGVLYIPPPGDQILGEDSASWQWLGVGPDVPGTWTLIPEPSTGLLLGFCLLGLAVRRRLRCRRIS